MSGGELHGLDEERINGNGGQWPRVRHVWDWTSTGRELLLLSGERNSRSLRQVPNPTRTEKAAAL